VLEKKQKLEPKLNKIVMAAICPSFFENSQGDSFDLDFTQSSFKYKFCSETENSIVLIRSVSVFINVLAILKSYGTYDTSQKVFNL